MLGIRDLKNATWLLLFGFCEVLMWELFSSITEPGVAKNADEFMFDHKCVGDA